MGFWLSGEDRLGGHDPYSASKAAAELAIASWRDSFYGSGSYQTPHLAIATARAGNVIGGGDWAEERIVPMPCGPLLWVNQFLCEARCHPSLATCFRTTRWLPAAGRASS